MSKFLSAVLFFTFVHLSWAQPNLNPEDQLLARKTKGYNHQITAFGGIGSLLVDNTHRATVALNYSYDFTFFSESVAAGLTVRYTFADTPEMMIVPLAIFNPFHQFKFVVGPAVAIRNSKPFAGSRGGFKYDFILGNVALVPEFNIDVFASNLTLVYGLSAGFVF